METNTETFPRPLEVREWKARHDSTTSEGLSLLESLEKSTGLSRVTLRVCLARGLESPDQIQAFLTPKLEKLKDPFCIRDMDLAVDRLVRARGERERVRIFGDYDVDGTTGAALLSWFFRDLALDFDAVQPDRFKDGYGLSVKAIDEAAAAGVRVLVTVDCGITSFDAADRARELGIDLIVVDHHQIDPVRGIPAAVAVINPQRADCTSGLKELCGCGVGFYLIRALRSRGRDLGWWKAGEEPNLKQHLDLVTMATAADMVPLIGDNHILVRQGMEVLKQSKKPGVRALLEAAGLSTKEVSPSHLGFVIGPRINASGRMSSASLALELMTTEDPKRAAQLANDLERLNTERAEIQNKIWDQVRTKVEAGLAEGKYRHAIAVGDPAWHEGVVGIVASRVTETFRKPAAVIAIREDFGKGSVRSFAGKDVLGALRSCSELLLGFGGHKYAAGLSVAPEKFDEFALAFDAAVGAQAEDASAKPLYTEGDCRLAELDFKALSEIEKLGPFGPGHPEPVFVVRAKAVSHSVLKERHLKLNLSGLEETDGDRVYMEAIWFHGAERAAQMDAALHEESEWAAIPEINRFRGRATPTLRVKDRRRCAESGFAD